MLQRAGQFDEHFLRHLKFCNLERVPAWPKAIRGPNDKIKITPHCRCELFSLKWNPQCAHPRLNQFSQHVRIVDVLIHLIAAVDKFEVHPVRATRLEGKPQLRHYAFIQVRGGARTFLRNRIIVTAVSNDRGLESGDELGARLQRFLYRFQAPRIMIPRMHAILIDCRGRPQNSQRIEQPDFVALLRQPNRYGRSIDSRPRHRNFRAHLPPAALAVSSTYREESPAKFGATGTSMPS